MGPGGLDGAKVLPFKKKGQEGDEANEGRDFTMGRMDVRVPPMAELQKLADAKVDWATFRSTIERDNQGYTLPSKADFEALKLEGAKKQERMGESGLGIPDGEAYFMTWEGDEPTRTKYLVRGDSYEEQHISDNDQTDVRTHFQESDMATFFLVKKSQAAQASSTEKMAA
ncbi:MAG TPA: hypothetical protein VJH06_00340 [Candidatus Paceibacterota bacterium]